MGISETTVKFLIASGHEAVHLREQGLHRLPDAQIMEKAQAEDRVVLTVDLDFGELHALSGAISPSVILIRTRKKTPAVINQKLTAVLAECESDLLAGAILLIEDAGYRVRRLPVSRTA